MAPGLSVGPREPVSVGFDGVDPVIGCAYCDLQERLPLHPTRAMLDAVDRFIHAHAGCRSIKQARGA